MKITIVSGAEMLTLCNRADKIAEIKETVLFSLLEHAGQFLYVEGDVVEDSGTVCTVQKNSDFTEGRGPMNFHKVFSSAEKAIDYIMTRPGIYGSAQGASNYAGVSIYGKPYCVSGFNGYDIKIVKVE
jgi:hypothetical protein